MKSEKDIGEEARFGDRRAILEGGLGNAEVGATVMGGNSWAEILWVELAEEPFLIWRGAGPIRCFGGLLRLLVFSKVSTGIGAGDSTVSKKSSYSFHTSSSGGKLPDCLVSAGARTKLMIPELLEPDRSELMR